MLKAIETILGVRFNGCSQDISDWTPARSFVYGDYQVDVFSDERVCVRENGVVVAVSGSIVPEINYDHLMGDFELYFDQLPLFPKGSSRIESTNYYMQCAIYNGVQRMELGLDCLFPQKGRKVYYMTIDKKGKAAHSKWLTIAPNIGKAHAGIFAIVFEKKEEYICKVEMYWR